MGAAFGLLMFAFVSRMRAHSWMRCSDYHAEITGQDYNETYCSGWMRGENFDNIYFGQEVEVGGPIHQVQIRIKWHSTNRDKVCVLYGLRRATQTMDAGH